MGNTKISIPISYDLSATIIDKEPVVSNYFVKVNKDNNFTKNNMSVFFQQEPFYEFFDMNFDVKDDICIFMSGLFLFTPILQLQSRISYTDSQGKVFHCGY
jgi:hypothetical protein